MSAPPPSVTPFLPSPDLLARCGQALYGPQWQTPLAKALGVHDRTMRRWVAGSPIPATVWPEIRALARQRCTDWRDLARLLPAA